MKHWHATICSAAIAIALAAPELASAQGTQQDLKAMEKAGQRDDMQPMTAAQQAGYKSQYEAAKAKWATMTPQEKQAAIASARNKKLSDLSAIELVGQRDDMRQETAAQTAQIKAEADAAKAKWDKMTPQQKQAVRKAAWSKKRAELDATEAVGQRDDSYVLPY